MAEETRNPDIEKLLPQDSQRGPLSGRLSDYMTLPESVRRAGRASGLAEAAGVETSPFINYPKTTGVMSALGGGAAGVLLARLINRKMGLPPGMELGFLPTQSILGALGAGVGPVVAGSTRRNEINSLKEQLKDKELDINKLEPGSMMAALGSGMHQLGKSDVVSGDTENKDYQSLANVGNLTRGFVHGMALPGAAIEGAANASAYMRAREILSNNLVNEKTPNNSTYSLMPTLGGAAIGGILGGIGGLVGGGNLGMNMRFSRSLIKRHPELSDAGKLLGGFGGLLGLGAGGAIGGLGGANVGKYLEDRKAHKTAGILPPKSLGDRGIQALLKDLNKRKKITKQPFPAPNEVLDRVAGYLADKGMLRKKSAEKQARCWEGFEPVPGKKPYTDGSCRPKTQTTKRVNEKRSENLDLSELVGAINKIKAAEATVTVYYASPNRQLVRIPKDAVVSMDQDVAYQMGRYYPETKETWSTGDVSGKWTGGTPQPNFRAGRMPMGRPAIYRAEVMQSDLAAISDMVKSVKKLRRSVNAVAVKQRDEKE